MALVPEEPYKRNGLLIVLVALAGAYFFYDYWYVPEAEEIEQLEQRLEALEDQNRQAQVLAARGEDELEERLMAYERHVNRLEQLIPESEELPGLLNAWAMEARNAPVDLARIRPESPREEDHYTMQSYEMAVVGDYHGVGRYLTALASLPRIVRPVGVQISPFTGEAPMDGLAAPVEAHFRVETYVIPSRPGDLEDLGDLEELPDGEEPLPEVEEALPDEEGTEVDEVDEEPEGGADDDEGEDDDGSS